MILQSHLVAARDVARRDFLQHMGAPGEELGHWRLSAAGGVGASDAVVLDERLGLLSRATGGVALRASVHGGGRGVVALQRDGRRVALFDHPLPTSPPDPAVEDEEAAADALDDLDDELAARLAGGETFAAARDAVARRRCDDLVAALAGTGVDRGRLLAALRAPGSPAGDRPVELPWGDLPPLLEALGLDGVAARLAAAWGGASGGAVVSPADAEDGELEDDDDDEAADEYDVSETEAAEASAADRPGRGRLACLVVVAWVTAAAVAGGWWARSYDSPLAVVGGAVLGGLVLGLAVPFALWAAFIGFHLTVGAVQLRRLAKRHTLQRQVDVRRRGRLLRALPPDEVPAARFALADWRELTARLRPESVTPPVRMLARYGDAHLPIGAGSEVLLARLGRSGGVAELAAGLADLRCEVLDRQLAGEPLDDLAPRLEALVASR